MLQLIIFQVKDKPIKYLFQSPTGGNFYKISAPGIQSNISSYLREENEKNCYDGIKIIKKIKLVYDKNLFPLLQLNKLHVHKNSQVDMVFEVKRHSRILLPYENLMFKIPKLVFTINDLFLLYDDRPSINLFLKNVFKGSVEATKIGVGRLRAWPYGNVYSSGNVCWGNRRIKSFKNIVSYLLANQEDTSSDVLDVYINMYMQYVYSEFFNSPFNTDLQSVSIFNLLDITDKLTVDTVNDSIKKRGYDVFNNVSNPLVYIKKNKMDMNNYISIDRAISIDKKMGEIKKGEI